MSRGYELVHQLVPSAQDFVEMESHHKLLWQWSWSSVFPFSITHSNWSFSSPHLLTACIGPHNNKLLSQTIITDKLAFFLQSDCAEEWTFLSFMYRTICVFVHKMRNTVNFQHVDILKYLDASGLRVCWCLGCEKMSWAKSWAFSSELIQILSFTENTSSQFRLCF